MLGWLKKKGIEVVQRQCKFNIKLNTETLVSIANRAYTRIVSSGGKENEYDITEVTNAKRRLIEDITLGYLNGLTFDEIETNVIQPILNGPDVSSGARVAVNHAIKVARDELGAQHHEKS